MKRVLIVDDSELILSQLEDILVSLGYTVAGKAKSGTEAVRKASKLRPDIIIMDIIMPGRMDGIAAANLIHEEIDVPILFLTGHDDDALIADAKKSGANGYLLKPINPPALKAAIEIALHKKESEGRLAGIYRDLVENTSDLIYIIDGQGNIKFFNDKMASFVGYGKNKEAIIGKSYTSFVTPRTLAFAAEKLKRQIKGEDIGPFEMELIDNNGGIHTVEMHERVVREKGRIVEFHGIGRDITDLRRAGRRHESLNRLKEYLLGPYDLDEKLKRITDDVVGIFGADFARIWLIEPGDLCGTDCIHAGVTDGPHACRYRDRCLHLRVSSGRYTHIDGKTHRRVPFGAYKIGQVAAGTLPKFIINDVIHDPLVHNHQWARKLGLTSFAGYRLLSGDGTPIGVLALFSKRTISHEEDALLEGLAGTTAQVIQTARTEEALRENERRFRLLAENANDIIFTMNTDFKLTYISPSVTRVRGFTVEEAMAMTPAEHMTPDSLKTAARLMQEKLEIEIDALANASKTQSIELEVTCKDGSTIWTETSLSSLRDQRGNLTGILGITRDITERRQAETTLRESEERYRSLFANSIEAVFTADLRGSFTDINVGFETISGYARDEVIGQSFRNFVDVKTADRVFKTYQELYCTGEPVKGLVYEYIHKNGEIRTSETSINCLYRGGKVVGFQGIFRDVTERKAAEEALRQRDRIFNQAIDMLCIAGFDGYFKVLNPSFSRVLGWSADELTAKPWIDFVHPDDRDATNGARSRLVDGKEVYQFENRYLCKDGSYKWLSWNSYPYPEEQAIFAVARDITEHRKIEEALKTSELTYREIFNTVNDTIWIHDIETWRFIDVNDTVTDMFGYSPGEAMDLSVEDISSGVPPFTRETALGLLKKAAAGQPQIFEWHCKHRDGHLFWTEVNLKRGTIAGKKCVLAIERDITQRKKAEEDLVESEKRYHSLFANSIEAAHTTDLNGNLTEVNKSFETISGYTRDELIGMNYRTLIDPENAAIVIKAYQHLYRTSQPIRDLTYDFIRKDGEKRRVEANVTNIYKGNEIIGYQGTFRDITERKRTEEALRDSEEKFRYVFEASRDFMYICTPGGKILDMNEAAKKFFGYSKEEIDNGNIIDFYAYPEERESFVEEVIKHGYIEDRELKVKDKNGNLCDVLVTVVTKRDARGKAMAFYGSVKDITEKKKLEQQLIQGQKMEAIVSLAGGVAHNFNNILVGIMGYSEYLLSRKQEGDPDYKPLKVIHESTVRAAELTRQLLNAARAGQYNPVRVNLNDVIEKTLPFVAGTFDTLIEIRTNLDKNLMMIEGDVGQIEQSLLALCVNARDAMPSGGKLTIETANRKLDEHLAKTRYEIRAGDYVVLSITDTGIGIVPELQSRIFDPFFTTKEQSMGTGMGLPTVYGIMKNHHGHITVDSGPGRGTTFTLYFPAVGQEMKPIPPRSTDADITERGTILIIDDESIVREMWSDFLTERGYKIITAEDGRIGADTFEKQKDLIDLVILDLIMPGMGGRETLERLRIIRPNIKVLISSGYSEDGQAKEILKEAVNGFIQKPVKLMELVQKINAVLAEG